MINIGDIDMEKEITWESNIEGKEYLFSYQRIKREYVLTINGISKTFPVKFMEFILGSNNHFLFDNKEFILVVSSNNPDVVVDGSYLRSKKQYGQQPAWVWIFIVLCWLIPVFTLGGALPVVIGLFGALLCKKISKTTLHILWRLLICALITLLAWALLFLLAIGIELMKR